MEGYTASIQLFGGNFAPARWSTCQGQILDVQSYTALFSLLGVFYGGDGRSNFALPDLRGRVACGWGNGPGLTPKANLGWRFGEESYTLNSLNLPSHNHDVNLSNITSVSTAKWSNASFLAKGSIKANEAGDITSPTNAYVSVGEADNGKTKYPVENSYAKTSNTNMASDSVEVDVSLNNLDIEVNTSTSIPNTYTSNTGNNLPFYISQPSTVVNYVICLEGNYPSRN